MGSVVPSAWCRWCESNVRPRDWDQDLYACKRCLPEVFRFIRGIGTGRIIIEMPRGMFRRRPISQARIGERRPRSHSYRPAVPENRQNRLTGRMVP